MNEILPNIVYALLSGLNASTVGIIALAAVQVQTDLLTCLKNANGRAASGKSNQGPAQ
jgi:hypothetical protein